MEETKETPKVEPQAIPIKEAVKPVPKKEEIVSPKKVETPKIVPKKEESNKLLAVILIRGTLGLRKEMLSTLKMLNLHGKYNCVVLKNNKVNNGMIFKMKDYITWGEINVETQKELETKRPKGKKKFHSLPPPRGGFERKGTKKTFKQSGALGDRKEKINDLIKRMI